MNRQTLSQTGRNTLSNTRGPVEVPSSQIDKKAIDAFKASTNLNKALFQPHSQSKGTRVFANTAKELLKQVRLVKQLQKHMPKPSEDRDIEAEVTALNHYRPPAPSDNTKGLVDKIITNRRSKHIQSLQEFEADIMEYIASVKDIYSAVKSEALEFIKINDEDISEYYEKLTDAFLMSKEKQILREIQQTIENNNARRLEKTEAVKNNLSSFQDERTDKIQTYCKALTQRLVESAFVLEEQADTISSEWRSKLKESQSIEGQASKTFITELEKNQTEKFETLKAKLVEKQQRWKQLKQEHALQEFLTDVAKPEYCNSDARKQLYERLKKHQKQIHNERLALIEKLVESDANGYTKVGIEKWLELVKTKNEQSNAQIDRIVNALVKEGEESKLKGEKRLSQLKNRLEYIELLSSEENEKVLSEKAIPLLDANTERGKSLLSNVAGYVEKYDCRQNEVCENMGKFMLKLGNKNDEGKKTIKTSQQSYDLSKAKLLDEDEEKVEKLNGQLQALKKQLRQSLHHIKLEDIEVKCFAKIDEIEQQYRQTHEQNKQLASQHPNIIEKDIQKIENDAAEIFRLYDQSKRAQLIEKNKKEVEEKALKRIELEDKKKAQEELRQAEQTKKKSGKAPPPAKPKDPKKAASELEERKQAILKEMGANDIKEFKSQTGKTWLIYQTVDDIAAQFYNFEDSPTGKQTQSTQQQPKPADFVESALKDCENNEVVASSVMFKRDYITQQLTSIRDKIFGSISEQKGQLLLRASEQDKDFLETSVEELDNRLKGHYSLKGKLESEIYVRRSTEITSHKKMYERHARSTREKMDAQTEKFNFLLEKSLQLMKTHNEQQKKVREELPGAKNLSQLQGTAGRNRQNSQRFGIEIKEILNELQMLSSVEVQNLINKNQEFLQQCKVIANGGDYSPQELEWYRTMMKEITTQLEQQKEKRMEKMNQIETHTTKKKQQFLDNFEKEYNICVEDLAAKDCSGKKYGKPKRMAQERIRGEMAKCEQAQQNIEKMMADLRTELERSNKKPNTLDIRRRLMEIRSCIGRYAKHIEALRADAKISEMPRINYNEQRSDTLLLGQQELEEDEKRKQAQLQKLGVLSQQKDDKKFSQLVDDIEKAMKDQAQKIYIGDKAKYLTGADKIPDYLREYIANMKKNAQAFRLNSVRDLRSICLLLCDLSPEVTSTLLYGIQNIFAEKRTASTMPEFSKFRELLEQMDKIKTDSMRKLRPNLANPACNPELNELDSSEKKRLNEFRANMNKTKELILDGQFKTSSSFLTAVLNSFEFLLLYNDSMILEEDFIKLPGDESKQKKHLNIKELMLMKQKGQVFDPNSQRNITKKWAGVSYSMYDCPNRKYEYIKTVPEQAKVDPKKAGKKQTKDIKRESMAEQINPGITKEIQSIKTDRQKSAFESRNSALEQFKKDFDRDLELFLKEFNRVENSEQRFEQIWNETVEKFRKGK